ncbi:glycosyltransferase family protein [Klebsiella quasipneumoniae]|uniref:hypothetical protein n=1 Tax=Klebsiella quasipneumoniae TaxID=1463165 RepID=UPI00388FE26C
MEKILIVTNEFYPFKGGIGRYCEELITETAKDFDVTLVAPKYDGSFSKTTLAKRITVNYLDGGQFKYWHLPGLIKKIQSIDFSSYDHVLVADWPFWIAIEIVNKYIPWKKNQILSYASWE